MNEKIMATNRKHLNNIKILKNIKYVSLHDML